MSEQEIEFIELYRSLSEKDKRAIRLLVDSLQRGEVRK